MQSVNAIAERCGVHASNFVRFAQALGYSGFKDLQELFQKRLSTAAPGFEARVKALKSELGARTDRSDFAFLRDLVVRDVASLEELLADVDPDDLRRQPIFWRRQMSSISLDSSGRPRWLSCFDTS